MDITLAILWESEGRWQVKAGTGTVIGDAHNRTDAMRLARRHANIMQRLLAELAGYVAPTDLMDVGGLSGTTYINI
jgi:hypothetical protein